MLIQFNYENFKSFYKEASLDMSATTFKEHSYNLIEIQNAKSKENYVKVAAIYGANASGKSSVIDAFEFMKYFVLNSFKQASDHNVIPLKNFAFNKEEKDSSFEVFFRKNDNEYQYGFKLNRQRVIEEWLYKRDFRSTNKFNTIFERNNEEFSINNLKSAKNFVDMVENKTLFISILSNAKIPLIKEVYDWFKEIVIIDFGNIKIEHMLTWTIPPEIEIEEQSVRIEIARFLNAIGVPIDELEFDKFEDEDGENYKIFSIYHHNNKRIRLPFNEESSGTIKMFTLFLHLKTVLEQGSVIFIDELDAKLHPLLLRYLITLFHDEETNPNHAQLIYTTHDNYTLTKDIFRRDQIWFVEKHSDLTAELYSLSEYKLDDDKKVRNDASFNKDYLLGKYGGVPLLKEFNLWGNEDEKN